MNEFENQRDEKARRRPLRSAQMIRLLLVEDNPDDADLFTELLDPVEEFDFVAKTVDSLNNAIKEIKTQKYDCIVVDLGLPDSQGLDTYKAIRGCASLTAIVVLTGQSDRDTMLAALRMGADNYLIKGTSDGNRIAVAILNSMRNYLRKDSRSV
jgi:DNA-binding response OmpR family regulator